MTKGKLKTERAKDNLVKSVVSGSYMLLYMRSRDWSDGSWEKFWHLKNNSQVGQMEFTLCGLSWVDGDADAEDFEFIKSKMGGKITCPQCLKFLRWCKAVE